MPSKIYPTLLVLALIAASSEAEAQVAAETTTERAGLIRFQPGFFSDYSPVTALDIVRRVPGFALSDGDTSRRGLGDAFGNVLINGVRPANKALALDSVLQRIPAADVVQVELIQEATPQYEMRGHANLVNIVLGQDAGSAGAWDLRVRLSPSGRVAPGFDLSQTSTHGDLSLTFALSGGWMGNHFRRRFSRHDQHNSLTEIQYDEDQHNYIEYVPSIAANWAINPHSSLLLNAQVMRWEWNQDMTSNISGVVGGELVPLRIEHARSVDDHGDAKTASLTYLNQFENGVSLESILLIQREASQSGPSAYATFDPVSGFQGAFLVSDRRHTDETAFRQTASLAPADGHTLEFGGEIAVNSSDTNLTILEDDGSSLTPIILPVSDTRVEERRGEIFGNHVWTISDNLSLESGLRLEFSEIEQTGDAEQVRSFYYPKPSVTLNWRTDEHSRIRFAARRDVDQLRFDRFASSVDVADRNSTIGNPDYVPERTWTLEGEWERRFGDEGFLSLLVGYDWVQDLDGFVPIATPAGLFDAPGNIGDGTLFRVTGHAIAPLDAIGIPHALLDITIHRYDTDIEDPLTGLNRHFDGYRKWDVTLDYRQIFPATQIAWGWDYYWTSGVETFRAREYRLHEKTDGDLDFYLETTRWAGITARIGVNAVINNGDDRSRVFYVGSRADGVVSSTEHRNESMGTTWYAQFRGTF